MMTHVRHIFWITCLPKVQPTRSHLLDAILCTPGCEPGQASVLRVVNYECQIIEWSLKLQLSGDIMDLNWQSDMSSMIVE